MPDTNQPPVLYTAHVTDALHPQTVTVNTGAGDDYLRYNYQLCRALDMTQLGIVLEKMVANGWMDKRVAELLHSQAATTLALLRTENNRCYAKALEDGTE